MQEHADMYVEYVIDSFSKKSIFYLFGQYYIRCMVGSVPLRRVTLRNACNIHRSLYYNNCRINMYELNSEDITATFKLSSFCPEHIKNVWEQRPTCLIRRYSSRSDGPRPSLVFGDTSL